MDTITCTFPYQWHWHKLQQHLQNIVSLYLNPFSYTCTNMCMHLSWRVYALLEILNKTLNFFLKDHVPMGTCKQDYKKSICTYTCTFNVVKFFDMGTLIINVIYNTDRRPILPPQTCHWQWGWCRSMIHTFRWHPNTYRSPQGCWTETGSVQANKIWSNNYSLKIF